MFEKQFAMVKKLIGVYIFLAFVYWFIQDGVSELIKRHFKDSNFKEINLISVTENVVVPIYSGK